DRGIIHRDLSPDNIILPEGDVDRAKLIDFGIAKSANPGDATVIGSAFPGKFSYAAPEQVGLFGGQVDARSDIYSLGPVLAAAAPRAPRNWLRPLLVAAGVVTIVGAAVAVALLRVSTPSGSPLDELRRQLAAATAGYQCAALDVAVSPDREVRVSGHLATAQE